MANPYYNEEQRRKLAQGQKAQKDSMPHKVIASLDSDTMKELKDINNNTLETALNTMDIKDNIKSFEDKFKEKFDGFKDQQNQDDAPTAEQSPDFVGPMRPPSLTDNSSSKIDNSVSIIQNSETLGKIEASALSIAESMLKLIDLYQKKDEEPLPDPEPEDEQEDSLDDKDKKDNEKKREIFGKNILNALKSIQSTTSTLLSRFIGYSLETVANFTKWTLIIGSLVMAVDVMIQTVKNWFNDILNEGEGSKKLFGSYLPQVKKIAESIDKGIDNFNMDNLGGSLKDLFIEPMSLLGDTIKTAITEGIGNLIYALGQYTGSETITNAGREMKLSALRDKQAAGLEINGDDLIMIRQDELAKQKEKESKASAAVLTSVDTSQSWQGSNSYNQMGQLADKKRTEEELKRVDAARQYQLEQKEATKQLERQNELLLKDPEYLKEQTRKENEANRKRVKEASEKAAQERRVAKENTSELDQATEYVDKENLTKEDTEKMDKLLESLEEKNNAKTLSSDDADRYRKILEDWQNKIHAVPEDTSKIDPPPAEKQDKGQTASTGNIQVNQKNVNNTVTHSVQRTEIKPLVSIG